MPVSNSGNGSLEPFFQIPVSELGLPDTFLREPFETLNVFSVSFYLRQLLKSGIGILSLPLPNAERRMQVLKDVIVH
jgi:hypothetical protein